MKEELAGIERYRANKERMLIQASSNLEAMQTTRSGLESELHQVLIVLNTCNNLLLQKQYLLLLIYLYIHLNIHKCICVSVCIYSTII